MIKQNKWKLLISSLLMLLPAAFGLAVWDKLPAEMATHWGSSSQADGFAGRGFVVFGLPLILLAVHWLCILAIGLDPKNRGQHNRVLGLILWFAPAVCIMACGTVYTLALGGEINPAAILFPLLGLMFIIFGNYMPKINQNNTMGIRVKWTLESEENWYATHRLAGKLWVAGGFVMLCGLLLPMGYAIGLLFGCLVPMVAVPIAYSYGFSKKHPPKDPQKGCNAAPKKRHYSLSAAGTAVVLALVAVLMLCGEITTEVGESSLCISADFYEDVTVDFADIDDVKYFTGLEAASRTYGFGSPKLSMGVFQNEQFGTHTRYVYNRTDCCIAIYSGERVLILNAATVDETEALYRQLADKY